MANGTDTPQVEIGLVMAGAISAGAYTAGVVDFLLQALSEWERLGVKGLAAKTEDPAVVAERHTYSDAPAHRAVLSAMSGASAGGMTAAITAASLGGDIDPATTIPHPNPAANRLYDSWVNRIDISVLLDRKDLEDKDAKVVSALDSTELERIAEDAIEIDPTNPERPYVSGDLQVFLTVANLRGVPYRVTATGPGQDGHGMFAHADYVHFVVNKSGSGVPEGALSLDPSDYGHPNWAILVRTALASGAFPLGLAPRTLERSAGDYLARKWSIPQEAAKPEDGHCECFKEEPIAPNWRLRRDARYVFLNVDGGLMDNEPLELARKALRRNLETGRNKRDGDSADRAGLMIDPFPTQPFKADYKIEEDVLSVFKSMFSALKAQARFKRDELVLAQNPNVYSRFMIVPTRTKPGRHEPEEKAIASGSLGGFGGFLSRTFREHDFNLGRRNCQKFLRDHFVLPSGNPLFSDWPEKLKRAVEWPHPDPGVSGSHLPIIPLVGEAAREVPWMEWPDYGAQEFETLDRQVRSRAKLVIGRLASQELGGLMGFFARVFGGVVGKRISKAIKTNLREFGWEV